MPRIRVGVVVAHEGKILLVCHRKGDRRYWMLPGGGLNWGETLAECGMREVREETAIHVAIDRLLYVAEALDPHGSRHIVNFVMLGTYRSGRLRTPTEEIIDTVEWCPVRDLQALTIYPPIGHMIHDGLSRGFESHPLHLGPIWAD